MRASSFVSYVISGAFFYFLTFIITIFKILPFLTDSNIISLKNTSLVLWLCP